VRVERRFDVDVGSHDVEAHPHDVGVRLYDGRSRVDVTKVLENDGMHLADDVGVSSPCPFGHSHDVFVR